MSKDKKLNLRPIPKVMNEAQAAQTLGEFYAIAGNCLLNLVPILEKISISLEEMTTELCDIKDNMNREGLKEGWLSEVDIAEREQEGDDHE